MIVRSFFYYPHGRLLTCLEDLQCRCFMGFFPEINRAWMTVDNQLFIWNYTNGYEESV